LRAAAHAAMIVGGMRLEDFLRHFVSAALAADRRYVRSHDAADIQAGIVVWEQLAGDPELEDLPSESLVDAYLGVSMLYARRHEALGSGEDLSLALRYLEYARRHVVAGSFADLQMQMSTAAWLMVRFQAEGRREDLDAAIAGWAGLLDSDAGALAAANLGRALLTRHDLSGDPEDRVEGLRVLGLASLEMPRDHPARADVEFALRAAG
jgi:hypothetical protein